MPTIRNNQQKCQSKIEDWLPGKLGQIAVGGVLRVVSSAFFSLFPAVAVLSFRSRLILPLFLIIFLAGCRASGPLVVRTSPRVEEVNAQLEGKLAEIRLVDGSRFRKVTNVQLSADSVFYNFKSQLYRTSGGYTIPLAQVNRIMYSPRRPTLIGSLVGALPGGILLYQTRTTECVTLGCGFGRFYGTILSGAIVLLGASLGTVVGYQHTERIIVYEGEALLSSQ